MQGHIVYVLDNLFTGKRKNIEHWMGETTQRAPSYLAHVRDACGAGHPNFMFFHQDVIHPFFMEVDQIYHLACPASPPHYQYNPIKVCGQFYPSRFKQVTAAVDACRPSSAAPWAH
jgi:UDP-glucuronate decarboxylase